MNPKLIQALVAAALLIGGTAEGLTAGGSFTRGCAGRDMQVMMMLEAGAISPQKKNDAVRNMTQARMMCFDGQVMDALALYDRIAHSIASDWGLAGEEH
jgi:hypothetical protein